MRSICRSRRNTFANCGRQLLDTMHRVSRRSSSLPLKVIPSVSSLIVESSWSPFDSLPLIMSKALRRRVAARKTRKRDVLRWAFYVNVRCATLSSRAIASSFVTALRMRKCSSAKEILHSPMRCVRSAIAITARDKEIVAYIVDEIAVALVRPYDIRHTAFLRLGRAVSRHTELEATHSCQNTHPTRLLALTPPRPQTVFHSNHPAPAHSHIQIPLCHVTLKRQLRRPLMLPTTRHSSHNHYLKFKVEDTPSTQHRNLTPKITHTVSRVVFPLAPQVRNTFQHLAAARHMDLCRNSTAAADRWV